MGPVVMYTSCHGATIMMTNYDIDITTLAQEVLHYSDKTSCQHNVTSQYGSLAESLKTDSDVT